MKILLLLSRCDQTGVTTHTLDLCEALVALGHDVTVLVGRQTKVTPPIQPESEMLYRKFVETGAAIVPYPLPDGNRTMGKIRSVCAVVWYMLCHRFDAIHVQSPYLSFIPWLLRRKFVSTLHVTDLVRCFYYKNATHLIAISRETKDYAKQLYGYRDEDITIVHHGVSLRFSTLLSDEEKAAAKQRLGIPEGKIIVGLVGSVERRKGHDHLLAAVRQMPQALRQQVYIVFLGSSKDGRTVDWLNGEIDRSGLRQQVSWFQYQSPETFYKIFDIFALPSHKEGFGLVVLEAMLGGCCCVRSNTEGSYEQIEDGKSGFIFEDGNVEQLSGILSRLVEDAALRRQVAKAGREKALREFTSEVMARNTVEVYKKITGKK